MTIGYESRKKTNVVSNNINFSIEKGRLIFILGKNGIGKSTLLKTISKTIPSIAGTILCNGIKIKTLPEQQLATQLSLVLTESLPESLLTVYELVALGRQPYTNWVDTLSDIDKEAVKKALIQTETLHLQNKPFLELSDGQLQRVLIARTLAQNTDIIILDEPTAHLDMHHTVNVFELLKKMVQEQQKTIIISSHEINLALQLADDIILFTEDKVYKNTPKNLIKDNIFDKLFSSEYISFNSNLQQFTFSKG